MKKTLRNTIMTEEMIVHEKVEEILKEQAMTLNTEFNLDIPKPNIDFETAMSFVKDYASKTKQSVFDLIKNNSFVRKLKSHLLGDSKELNVEKEEQSVEDYISSQDLLAKRIVTIPYFGTFDLNPIQIGLIACLTEFYFGNKQKVLKIINSVFNSNITLAASLDYSLKNLYTLLESSSDDSDESNPLDEARAKKFLNALKESNLLDEKYNLNKNIIKASDLQGDMITKSIGYLFEVFLNKSMKDDSYNVLEDTIHITSLCKNKHVKYSASILNVIYICENLDSLTEDLFNDENTTKITEIVNKLYAYKIKKEDILSGVKRIIDPDLSKEKLTFEFQFKGSYKKNPIDLVVKYNNNIVAMLDLKSSLDLVNTETKISSSKEAVNNQIRRLLKLGDDEDVSTRKDFNIGIIRIAYSLTKEGIHINQVNCAYQLNGDKKGGHIAILNTDIENDDDKGSYRLIKDNFIVSNGEDYYPIKKIDEDEPEDFVKKTLEYNNKQLLEKTIREIKDKIINGLSPKDKIIKFINSKYIKNNQENKSKIREHIFSFKNEIRKLSSSKSKDIIKPSNYNNVILYNYAIQCFSEKDEKNYNEHKMMDNILYDLKNKLEGIYENSSLRPSEPRIINALKTDKEKDLKLYFELSASDQNKIKNEILTTLKNYLNEKLKIDKIKYPEHEFEINPLALGFDKTKYENDIRELVDNHYEILSKSVLEKLDDYKEMYDKQNRLVKAWKIVLTILFGNDEIDVSEDQVKNGFSSLEVDKFLMRLIKNIIRDDPVSKIDQENNKIIKMNYKDFYRFKPYEKRYLVEKLKELNSKFFEIYCKNKRYELDNFKTSIDSIEKIFKDQDLIFKKLEKVVKSKNTSTNNKINRIFTLINSEADRLKEELISVYRDQTQWNIKYRGKPPRPKLVNQEKFNRTVNTIRKELTIKIINYVNYSEEVDLNIQDKQSLNQELSKKILKIGFKEWKDSITKLKDKLKDNDDNNIIAEEVLEDIEKTEKKQLKNLEHLGLKIDL